MIKTIGAYVNVALADYDETLKKHLVELMKDSLREQTTEHIFEDTWEVVLNKRTLYENEEGQWEIPSTESIGDGQLESSKTREILEVMTINITAKVEENV